jgi:hypothetical protein
MRVGVMVFFSPGCVILRLVSMAGLTKTQDVVHCRTSSLQQGFSHQEDTEIGTVLTGIQAFISPVLQLGYISDSLQPLSTEVWFPLSTSAVHLFCHLTKSLGGAANTYAAFLSWPLPGELAFPSGAFAWGLLSFFSLSIHTALRGPSWEGPVASTSMEIDQSSRDTEKS